jgi:hypothetical protein
MQIPFSESERIGREITSDDSPVGIDARKTHIIIIHMLEDIQRRLEDLDRRIASLENDANG